MPSVVFKSITHQRLTIDYDTVITTVSQLKTLLLDKLQVDQLCTLICDRIFLKDADDFIVDKYADKVIVYVLIPKEKKQIKQVSKLEIENIDIGADNPQIELHSDNEEHSENSGDEQESLTPRRMTLSAGILQLIGVTNRIDDSMTQ